MVWIYLGKYASFPKLENEPYREISLSHNLAWKSVSRFHVLLIGYFVLGRAEEQCMLILLSHNHILPRPVTVEQSCAARSSEGAKARHQRAHLIKTPQSDARHRFSSHYLSFSPQGCSLTFSSSPHTFYVRDEPGAWRTRGSSKRRAHNSRSSWLKDGNKVRQQGTKKLGLDTKSRQTFKQTSKTGIRRSKVPFLILSFYSEKKNNFTYRFI